MRRGPSLDPTEKVRIKTLAELELTDHAIAARIKRSQGAVLNYMKALKVGRERKRLDRKPKLEVHAKKMLLREGRMGKKLANQLRAEFTNEVGFLCVPKIISADPHFITSAKKGAQLHRKPQILLACLVRALLR